MSVITINNISKRFGRQVALDGVSFTVEEGDIFGFLGPNGAGKSTTLRCLLDFLHPNSGKITIFDKDAHRDSVRLRKLIGYVPAEPMLYADLSVKKHIAFVATGHTTTVLEKAHELASQLGLDVSKRIKQLSTGNQQKVALILALAAQPKLLILDEPTRGLDPLLRSQLHDILRDYRDGGGTVLLSSHDLSEVDELCNRIAVIQNGKVIEDTSMEKLRKKQGHTIKIIFDGPAPNLTDLASEIIHQTHQSAEFIVRGDMQPTLALLAKQKLKDITIRTASLEDIFMELYA